MIERLTTEVKRYAEHADRRSAEQRRPSMVWHLDPMTGKPAARWVFDHTEGAADQQLSTAA
jgi:hypothetical protein